jgi:hypothetical protein
MDITTEYARLQTLASTPDGWETLEAAWNTAMGQEMRDGTWYNISASKGDLVVGFAIDPETKHHILDTISSNHSWAKDQMVDWLMKEHDLELEEAEWRPVKGWAGRILDFQFPCIFMADQRFITGNEIESELLLDLERSIVEQGIGLPLSSLFRTSRMKHQNEVR